LAKLCSKQPKALTALAGTGSKVSVSTCDPPEEFLALTEMWRLKKISFRSVPQGFHGPEMVMPAEFQSSHE